MVTEPPATFGDALAVLLIFCGAFVLVMIAFALAPKSKDRGPMSGWESQ